MPHKYTQFRAGDKVTYLDIIHATVLHASRNGVVITYWGRGYRMEEQITVRVSSHWVEHGWDKGAI